MSYQKIKIENPFGYDSCYTLFIKKSGNESVIVKLQDMFEDEDCTLKSTSATLEDFERLKREHKYSGEYDREEIVLIKTVINITSEKSDYLSKSGEPSNKKWVKAVFNTNYLKHLDFAEAFYLAKDEIEIIH